MKRIHIAYLGGCWPTNIGNAFIDMGSMQSLRMALPGCQVSLVSELPRWLFWRKGKIENALHLPVLLDCDFIVVSGMVCCDEFLLTMGPILREAKKRGIWTIFNGCGQGDYTEKETENFREFLREIDPPAFISRDSVTFQNMKGSSRHEHDGIDCAFFLPEAHEPARFVDRHYVVLNFDSMKEPRLDLKVPAIRTHHAIFEDIPKEYVRYPDTLASDLPNDYLNVYAHCSALYSDRVHACIAALVYGKRARLFSKTPRGFLFDRVGAGAIREGLVSLDREKIGGLKRDQIEFLRAVLWPDEEPAWQLEIGTVDACAPDQARLP